MRNRKSQRMCGACSQWLDRDRVGEGNVCYECKIKKLPGFEKLKYPVPKNRFKAHFEFMMALKEARPAMVREALFHLFGVEVSLGYAKNYQDEIHQHIGRFPFPFRLFLFEGTPHVEGSEMCLLKPYLKTAEAGVAFNCQSAEVVSINLQEYFWEDPQASTVFVEVRNADFDHFDEYWLKMRDVIRMDIRKGDHVFFTVQTGLIAGVDLNKRPLASRPAFEWFVSVCEAQRMKATKGVSK